MAWIRQLPPRKRDGKALWAATYYTGRMLASGNPERRTVTDELKGVVEKIAAENEVDIRRRDWVDPRGATRTVSSVWEQYSGSRQIEQATKDKDESHWRTHVKPRWGDVAVGAILKPHVQDWVKAQEEDPQIGGWTIIAALNVLKAALELAVDAGLMRANPARRVKGPFPPAHVDRILSIDERQLILQRADELYPGRRDGWLFLRTLDETGCRYEEIAAVQREAVDLKRRVIHIGPVQERNGTIRKYPKAARGPHSAGFRKQPIGKELVERLTPVVDETAPGGRIYTASKGGPLLYPTWRSRVWVPIVRVAVIGPDGKPTGTWEPLVDEPLPTPHDLRHGYGTRLGDAGVERHHLQAAMGHDDYRSSGRYVHSEEDERLRRVRDALGL